MLKFITSMSLVNKLLNTYDSPIITSVGSVLDYGELKASPKGNKIALSFWDNGGIGFSYSF